MKKTTLLIFLLFTVFINFNQAQSMEQHQATIKQLIQDYGKATAKRSVKILEHLLHPEYRVLANRFQGKAGVMVIKREDYLKLMADEKIGGTPYETEIHQISVTGHTAMVDLSWKSKKASDYHKYVFLVLNEEDKWQIISDLPIATE